MDQTSRLLSYLAFFAGLLAALVPCAAPVAVVFGHTYIWRRRVESKDRLVRFGFRYIEQCLAASNVTIDITNGEELKSVQQGLVDMLAIIAGFSARLYGQRPKKFCYKVKEAIAECSTPSVVNSSTRRLGYRSN